MSKKRLPNKTKSPVSGYTFIKKAGDIEEHQLKSNSLRVLYMNKPDTGVVTTNITYLVGSRDEVKGETGLAHMLEHMLFKPTKADIEAKRDSGAMNFERNVGCTLNANTWNDRTTYYFSYPVEHFERAIQIEAERMTGVVLTDKEFQPERGNVLSEFDMYNGDPEAALAKAVDSVAYQAHPYSHPVIGYREDIEDYTTKKLERFYRNYYRPDNAIMMIIGDIDRKKALAEVKLKFSHLKKPDTQISRHCIREPKQEGIRRTSLERPSTTNIVSIGYKVAGFPTQNWFINEIMKAVLCEGPESILPKKLIDTGLATSIDTHFVPSSETHLDNINITLSAKQDHAEIEKMVLKIINQLKTSDISNLVKKAKLRMINDEIFARDHSLNVAQELTEYAASGHWEAFVKTEKILSSITPKQVIACMKESFVNSNMTIGYFIGKE